MNEEAYHFFNSNYDKSFSDMSPLCGEREGYSVGIGIGYKNYSLIRLIEFYRISRSMILNNNLKFVSLTD